MKNLKEEIIKSILEKVENGTKTIDLDPTELFNSVPISVPHDSGLLEVRIEVEVSKEGVKYKCEEEVYGWEQDYDDEEELENGFFMEFNHLTLLQLVLILENC